MARGLFVWLHRWTGLLMAGFLIVVGLTGSLLAFYGELNSVIAPELYPAPRAGGALDLAALAARAEAVAPGARTTSVYLVAAAPVAEIMMEAKPGAPALDFEMIYLDRRSGAELGRLFWGAFPTSRLGVMPFIYKIHFALAAGEVGSWILGLVALAWTIDCFVGFYLTLPTFGVDGRKGFLARWRPAWTIKPCASFYRLTFDLHRACGLWLWAMLFVYAWSSVYMNLDGFYSRAMSVLFDYQIPLHQIESAAPVGDVEPMSWATAQRTARRLMAEQGRVQNFEIEQEIALNLFRETSSWEYRVRSSRDVGDKNGLTALRFDAETGVLQIASLPTGQRAGNTITSWLYELHKANLFGLPYKIFVSFVGLAVAFLSVTGVYVWWKKRAARRFHNAQARQSKAPVAWARGRQGGGTA